jgi:hypothetical protein
VNVTNVVVVVVVVVTNWEGRTCRRSLHKDIPPLEYPS